MRVVLYCMSVTVNVAKCMRQPAHRIAPRRRARVFALLRDPSALARVPCASLRLLLRLLHTFSQLQNPARRTKT